MRTETAKRIAWPSFALFGLLAVAGLYLLARADIDFAENTVFVAIFLAMAGVGALVGSRQPGNPIGWLLLASCCVIASAFVAAAYSTYGYRFDEGLPLLPWAAWISTWPWPLGIGLILTFLILLFPDGGLPSRRWKPVAWASGIAIGVVCVSVALMPGRLEDTPAVNPLGIPGTHQLFDATAGIAFLALAALAVASVISLLVRFRHSAGEQRKQIAWFLFAAALLVVDILVDTVMEAFGVTYNAWFVTVLDVVAFVSIPAAVGIAILKYRLYEIDTVIRKSVVVGVLAAFITLVYLGIVVGIGALVGSQRNILLSISATAIIALAFQPLRERVRRVADRLVYGERATPYEVLADFSKRAGGTFSTDEVLPQMVQILAAGTGATHARVWLRVGSEFRVGAAWPDDLADASPIPVNDDLSGFAEGEHAFGVLHGGDLLGAISVVMPARDPLTPDGARLLRDAAAQAGLILRNVGLIEELRDSRRRIVAAQDQRAKTLERNIHDGAQQQLVALTVKLRLLEKLAGHDPGRAVEIAGEVQRDATDALENLRDLARGIYPPLLADQGLEAALAAQVRKASVPVSIEVEGLGRYSQDVESAVYFSCLEALQNVTKYAEATQAYLRLSVEASQLVFQIVDDGVGFDADSVQRGSGLVGMADRIEAIGGALEIQSRPRMGTSVAGRVPV